MFGIIQPRRIAAITVAKRVAEECGIELGQKVGYSVRFDDTTSSSTRIKYMRDGLLLSFLYRISDVFLYAYREALLDPYLSKYSVIIVDEAHERTVHTDVLLALLKNVQSARSRSIADDQGVNFGKKNVNAGMSREKEYGALPSEQQLQVFAPAPFGFCKVILATNIVETSVTISGVNYVIDPDFIKARSYDFGKDMKSLIIVPTSKSQALQRMYGARFCFNVLNVDCCFNLVKNPTSFSLFNRGCQFFQC
ncbi:hypothetical protein HN51_047201 [Arachis hypogaea]